MLVGLAEVGEGDGDADGDGESWSFVTPLLDLPAVVLWGVGDGLVIATVGVGVGGGGGWEGLDE